MRNFRANEDIRVWPGKAKTKTKTHRHVRECESLDRQIDQAVYELYGLTEEEIKAMEGKNV